MSTNTAIEWTDATWNPVVGCTRISAGCKNCYAHQLHDMRHKAFQAGKKLPAQYAQPFTVLQMMHGRLDEPIHWARPRRIFVNSVSDLFHEDVPFEFIAQVWSTMAICHWHTFQILTKRLQRALDFFEWAKTALKASGRDEWWKGYNPLPNVQIGASVENQPSADMRIPLLVRIPAAVRFLSCEPLLGLVDLQAARTLACPNKRSGGCERAAQSGHRITQDSEDGGIWVECACSRLGGIEWVIAGGESGKDSRPMHPDWARSMRDQCQSAGVPFFFKQWGEWRPAEFADDWIRECDPEDVHHHATNQPPLIRVGKKRAGRLLDGREWNEFPSKKEG